MMKLSKKLKKTISWNAIATGLSSAVYYAATGSIGVVPLVVFAGLVVFPAAYYLHERAWEGRK